MVNSDILLRDLPDATSSTLLVFCPRRVGILNDGLQSPIGPMGTKGVTLELWGTLGKIRERNPAETPPLTILCSPQLELPRSSIDNIRIDVVRDAVEERHLVVVVLGKGTSSHAGSVMAATINDASNDTQSPGVTDHDGSRDNRDATELDEIHPSDSNQTSSNDSVSSEEYRITPRRTQSQSQASQHSSMRRGDGWFNAVRKFWTRSIVLTVPQKSSRDHLALERTFLAYIRTSVATSMLGVLIAQLFRLQRATASPPPHRFGFYAVGIPLSVVCHSVAILIAAMGAHRFWKQQHAMALGTVYVGGWELNCIAILISAVALTILVLAITILAEIDAR
ncbi:hypothetical protein ANI_1_1512134 [Paecilomyces variotii No. 5]|uniref:DUF202 domain-containing protein n=1 Tax=Byssochlamys spectabilis (strain No. 5 / NBRC 109023) TaxID=1356009 RepID=V5G5G5_BYSSN|nr:hypothetical protein ANI_1_1512134 [Paecilomyces variotii No. 5]